MRKIVFHQGLIQYAIYGSRGSVANYAKRFFNKRSKRRRHEHQLYATEYMLETLECPAAR